MIEIDLLRLPDETELAEMFAYGMAAAERAEHYKRIAEHRPGDDTHGDRRKYSAPKWRTGWDFPGGKKLNPPRQKYLKTRRSSKPFLKRQAVYLAEQMKSRAVGESEAESHHWS